MEVQQQNKTLEFNIYFGKGRNSRQQLRMGDAPDTPDIPKGSIPRISRLMALAIKMEGMIRRGEVKNYAELAVIGHVSRARITQIMAFLNIAPDIQEEILHLPETRSGRDTIREKNLHTITAEQEWPRQRKLWKKLIAR